MARSVATVFITEIPLLFDSKQDLELLSRFQAARQLYNACLNSARSRLHLVGNSQTYQAASIIPSSQKKKLRETFNTARKNYRYSDYDIQADATIVSKKSKWIAEKIDSNTQQILVTRAFRASGKVLFASAKKVRYKVPSRFRSVKRKTNKQGIRWKDNQLVWGKLKLTPIIDDGNPVRQHGLKSPVKYVRILWRELNGRRRWYIQLYDDLLPPASCLLPPASCY